MSRSYQKYIPKPTLLSSFYKILSETFKDHAQHVVDLLSNKCGVVKNESNKTSEINKFASLPVFKNNSALNLTKIFCKLF